MFNWLISLALKQRLFVLIVAIMMVAYGALVTKELPVDVFPDLNRPTVTIMTEAHGLAPEEVEALVTYPLEAAMNGVTGVERVRSASSIGFSIVWVEFGWDTEVYHARQMVNERLQQVNATFSKEIQSQIAPVSSIMGEIMLIGLTSNNETVTAFDLHSMAEWELRQRLLTIPGIAQISVIGGEPKQWQVLVDPQKMQRYQLSLADIEKAIEGSNLNSTGGFYLGAHQEALIRSMGRLESKEALAEAVIPKVYTHETPTLTVGDVATIKEGSPIAKRGDASLSGKPAIILSIQKQPQVDTLKLSEQIQKELQSIQKTLPKGVQIHSDLFRQSIFIENAIKNIQAAIKDGAIVVAIILFLFLLNVRTTVITLIAIPTSLLITAIIFKWFDMSLNTMTLGGLAVAVGELVDDAIVDVENVFRRLKENNQREQPLPVLEVIYQASSEVRNSIVFATLIVIMVFVPLFTLGGIEGKIFMPLGIAYVVSIIASLIVSLTLTPVLCSYLLTHSQKIKKPTHSMMVVGLQRLQSALLKVTLPYTLPILMLVIGVFIFSLFKASHFGHEFLPEFNEGSVTISFVSAPGTGLSESNRIGTIAEKLLLEIPEIKKTSRRTGRAELDEHAMGVHSSEIELELHDQGRTRPEILKDIRDRLSTLPGIVTNIGQPISHRIDHMLSGVRAQVAIKIFGDNLDVLQAQAKAVENVIRSIDGVVDLQSETNTQVPQLHIRFNRAHAKQHGVSIGEVSESIESALQGKAVTQVIEGKKTFDVVVRFDDATQKEKAKIAQLPIQTLKGNYVPLKAIADIEEGQGPSAIQRENISRRIVIQANIAERDLVSTVKEIQKQIEEKIQLPSGYFLQYDGQFESQQSASRTIFWLSLLSVIGMFIALYIHFKSIGLAIQVMVVIPLALIGAVAGIHFTSGILSVATMIGFITLAGIAARNGIMMISHYLHLMKYEDEKFTREMLIRGTNERLVPVLMTALTAALALLPLVLAGNEPGKEILHPVAVVILSGLFSSTLLNLLVTPLIFWRFSRKSIGRLLPHALEIPELKSPELA